MGLKNRGLLINVDTWYAQIFTMFASAISVLILVYGLPQKETDKNKPRKKLFWGKVSLVSFGVILLGLCALIICTYFIYAAKVLKERLETFEEYGRAADLVIAGISFCFMNVTRPFLFPLFAKLGRVAVVRGNMSDEEFENRVQRFAGQFWKLIMHTLNTILPLVICRNEKWWLPGFEEDIGYLYENYPYVPGTPRGLRDFYMFELGYYFHATIVTMMQTWRRDYVEMILHHAVTVGLVVVSYFLMNMVRFGTQIFWLHDATDIFICLVRLLQDAGWNIAMSICYFILLASWVMWRLVIYPWRIFIFLVTSFRSNYVQWKDAYGWTFIGTMFIILLGLHVMWLVELIKTGAKYFNPKGKKKKEEENANGETPLLESTVDMEAEQNPAERV